jgi:protein O-GlcNAc transferase
VALFVPPLVRDEYSDAIRSAASTAVELPLDLDAARRTIASLRLDVLFYQDINMEPFTYLLAFARLAHVQCTSFGHPDTTGIPAMDWFVTSELFEPAANAGHYSERLFSVRGAPTLAYYYRPAPPPALSRAELGLPDDQRLYVCAQNLFKFHPDFDSMLSRIVRRDPGGRIVLIGSPEDTRTRRLLARLESVQPGISDRIIVTPRRPEAGFLALLRAADVVLDTPHFNGMNSSLEAFAMGTPIVTLPGEFQRGRHTQAMYQAMGIDDGVARDDDDYVDRAVAIAGDPDRRRNLAARILERCDALFGRDDVIREFERFFETAYAAAAGSGNGVNR